MEVAADPLVAESVVGIVVDAQVVGVMLGMVADAPVVVAMVGTDEGARVVPELGAEVPADVAVVRQVVVGGSDALAVAAQEQVGLAGSLRIHVLPVPVRGEVAEPRSTPAIDVR